MSIPRPARTCRPRRAAGWADALLGVRHYLYAVHRSRSYLTPPSLAASLYLLVLRWIARDFAAACGGWLRLVCRRSGA